MDRNTISSLMTRLKRVQRDLVRIQAVVVNWDGTQSAGEVKVVSNEGKALKAKFEEIQDAFDLKASEEDVATHEPTFDTIVTALINVMAGIENVNEARSQAKEKNHVFKFDKLKIPTFSGELSEWPEFADLFKAAIHNNENIAGAAKMVYLKDALTGEAKEIIQNTSATAASYEEAWKRVEARYSHPREIGFAHLRKFYKLQRQADTSTGIRKVCDTINECIRSLKLLKIEVDKWDVIMVFLSLKKIDEETKKQWLLTQGSALPKLADLLDYLEKRATALSDSPKPNSGKSNSNQKSKSGDKQKTAYSASTSTPTSSSTSDTKSFPCVACCENHPLFHCPTFRNLSLGAKENIVKKNKMCRNCFSRKHDVTTNPSDCKSKYACRECGERHNTLLHRPSKVTPPKPTVTTSSNEPSTETPCSSTTCSFGSTSPCHVLLETALVSVSKANGDKETVRVFVDKGSKSEFISENCVARLGLQRYGSPLDVTGIAGAYCGSTGGQVKLTLRSNHSEFQLPIVAEILPKVTQGNLPQCLGKSDFRHVRGLPLADPQFNQPQPIDVLLGARHASLIKTGGLIHGPPGTPSAEATHFGWLLSGILPSKNLSSHRTSSHTATVSSHHATTQHDGDEESNFLLQKFWESEEPEPHSAPRTLEDSFCEELFTTTTTRNSEGRYTVHLPFRPKHPKLQKSLSMAQHRFKSVENRMHKDPALKEFYMNYFRENLEMGILQPIPPDQIPIDPAASYYMPYSHVVKPNSSTTKVRIVFDCSAKTAEDGPSLNEVMCPGPKLQVDLMPLLIRFRTYPYALSADITKFFTQFPVTDTHQDFQRLIFRGSQKEPFQHFRMTRITFGVTAAPFLAIRSLHQLFEDECDDERVKEVIKKETLVDNVLTGSFSIPSAIQIQSQLIQTMAKGKLELRKWASNSPELLNSIPADQREMSLPIPIKDFEGLPTLGYQWNPSLDTFSVVIPLPPPNFLPTKRTALSQVARLYDPSGWLSPVTIRPKLLLQELWKSKIDWDTPLSGSLLQHWNKYAKDLPLLQKFTIPRCYTLLPTSDPKTLNYQVVGFSDASNLAYSAVVYIRTSDISNGVQVSLLGAKTKVAPIKGETTPRLELDGARLLSRFIKTAMDSLPVPVTDIICYSDSTSVLGWVHPHAKEKQDVYVTNRVRSIHRNIPTAQWRHVSGSDNPADCASRGISSQEFLHHPLWLQGPSFLKNSDLTLPTIETFSSSTSSSLPESLPPPAFYQFIMDTSSFHEMKRVAVILLRLGRSGKSQPKFGPPTPSEQNEALKMLVKTVQKETFPELIDELASKTPNLKKKIRVLAPFLDQDGLLRVGGRIQKAEVPFHQKHPLLLPKGHHFSQVVARHYHQNNLHAGPTLLLCLLREKFWIYGGPVLVKKIVRNCVTCHKHNPKPLHQLMSNLPEARVTQARPFARTGMDFAGPFTLCVTPGRNPRLTKSYFCIFVCMAIKAAHLELVEDLSTPAFIAALKRFTSRRGLPSSLYCDGGKNFEGAKNELDLVVAFLNASDTLQVLNNYAAENGISFHVNTPLAPHHGGLWEAAVKSAKYHLYRIIGDRHLSHQEFGTLLTQVEAALNSRPLTPMSSDPNDFEALTPAHFLIGSSLHSVPEEDLTDRKEYGLTRWQKGQRIFQEYWRRFHSEYLQTLQSRPKWLINQPDVTPGTLVLVKESDAAFSSHKWNLARVTQVFPGSDGRVRVAEIKTAHGSLLRRPIVKLSPLPLQ